MQMKRGRKSAEEIAASGLKMVSIDCKRDRLPVPAHFSGAAIGVWREIVNSRPGDYFDVASAPILETYVLATVEYRRLAAIAVAIEPNGDLNTLNALSKISRLVDMHASRMQAAATRLRLTNQSRIDSRAADRAARPQAGTKPWDMAGALSEAAAAS
jgi:hypothetical protein